MGPVMKGEVPASERNTLIVPPRIEGTTKMDPSNPIPYSNMAREGSSGVLRATVIERSRDRSRTCVRRHDVDVRMEFVPLL